MLTCGQYIWIYYQMLHSPVLQESELNITEITCQEPDILCGFRHFSNLGPKSRNTSAFPVIYIIYTLYWAPTCCPFGILKHDVKKPVLGVG